MSVFFQFDCLTHNETARKAMENYIEVLQKAFELHRNLWENYVKLQEKYEKRDVHLSFETDKLCREVKKELVSQEKQLNNDAGAQEQLNNDATPQKPDSRPFLELDALDISFINFNSVKESSFSSPSKSPYKIATSPPKSPVFSRICQKIDGASVRKLVHSAASVHNNSLFDMKPYHGTKETTFAKCSPKLEISTSHHVETTILPDGKKLKQARLVFHPAKCNEKKVSLPNTIKPASILPKTEGNSTSNISVEKAFITSKNNATSINEAAEDVIEISPTQRNVTSRVRHLKLKRKAPIKQTIKCSPRKNNSDSSAIPEITINNIDFALCPLPKYTSAQVEDDKDDKNMIKPIVNSLKSTTSDFPSREMYSESHVLIAKPIKTERESQSEVNDIQVITQNTNNFDETFYLPAELAAKRRNNMDDISLHDIENKPPVIKISNKDMKRRKENIPEQFNMRCKADRVKLDGWDCWECKLYYKNLSLSEEELQKRKNHCSRHRHIYERPNTPEGFWDPEFPETSSSFTYR